MGMSYWRHIVIPLRLKKLEQDTATKQKASMLKMNPVSFNSIQSTIFIFSSGWKVAEQNFPSWVRMTFVKVPPVGGVFPFLAADPWHFDHAQDPRIYPGPWGFPPWVCFIIHNVYVCMPQVRQTLFSGMQWHAVAISFAPLWPPITVIIYFRLCSYASLSSSSKGLCMLFSLRKAVVQYGPAEGEKRRAGPHSRSGGSGRSTSIAG